VNDQSRVARGFSWLVAGYAGRTLAYAGLTAILARSLDPAGFGRLSVFLALAAGIAALAGSWPFLSVPLLVGAGRDMAAAFMPALLLAGCLGVLLGLLSIPLSDTFLQQDGGAVITLLAYAIALIALQGLYAVLQTQGRMRTIAGAQTGERAVAALVVAGIAAAGGLTVARAQASLAVAGALACVGTAVLTLRSTRIFTPIHRSALRAGLADLFEAVGPMAIVSVCTYVIAWIDVLLLALFKPDSTVGHYALAYQIFMIVLQVASLWIVAALPIHVATATRDPAALRLPVDTARRMVVLWSAAVAAFAAGVALALVAVFGSDYERALAPSLALLASTPPLAAYFAVIPILLAQKRAREVARVAIAFAALNLGLDLALIPSLGLWAPVLATVTVDVAASIAILVILVGRKAALRILAPCAPACLAIGALAAAPHSPLATGAVLLVAAGAAIVGARSGRPRHAPQSA
jgi:O-antigen/teichoic acid export membrane protein